MASRKKLLLVDPLLAEQQALVEELHASGYELRRASNAAEAIALLLDFRPDVLLSEVRLPGAGDGLHLVESIRSQAQFAALPVILFGREPTIPQRIRGLELGVSDFLDRPLYLKEVLSRIQVLLEKHALAAAPIAPQTYEGSLADENLLQLLERMLHEQLSGMLELRGEDQRGQVWLRGGEVQDARVGALRGERALNRLFLWHRGQYALQKDASMVPPSFELSTRNLIFEAKRRQKEWDRLLPSLPSLHETLEVDERKRNQRVSIIPDDLELILGICDGSRNVEQVIEDSGLDEVAALELVSRLYGNGMLRHPSPTEDRGGRSIPEPAPIPSVRRLEVTTTPPQPLAANIPSHVGMAAADTIIEPAPVFATDDGESPHRNFRADTSDASMSRLPDVATRGFGSMQDTLIDDAPLASLDSRGSQRVEISKASQPTPESDSAGGIVDKGPQGTNDDVPAEDSPGMRDAPPRFSGGKNIDPVRYAESASLPNPVEDGADEKAQTAKSEIRLAGEQNDPNVDDAKRFQKPDAAAREETTGNTAAGEAEANESGRQANHSGRIDAGAAATGHSTRTSDTAQAQDSLQARPGNQVRAPAADSHAPAHENTDRSAKAAHAAADNRSTAESAPGTQVENASEAFLPKSDDSFFTREATDQTPGQRQSEPSDDELIAQFNSGKNAGIVFGVLLLLIALGAGGAYFVLNNTSAEVKTDAGIETPADPPPPASTLPETAVETPPVDAPIDEAPPTAQPTLGKSQSKESLAPRKERAKAEREDTQAKNQEQKRKRAEAEKPTAVVEGASAKPNAEKRNPKKEDEIYTQKLKEAQKLAKKNDFRGAIAAYLLALEVRGNSGEAHLGLGNAYYEVNEVKNAIRHLEKARAVLRRDPQVYILLGAVYQTANRKKDAITAYEKYLELAPNGRYARDVKNLLIGLKGQ